MLSLHPFISQNRNLWGKKFCETKCMSNKAKTETTISILVFFICFLTTSLIPFDPLGIYHQDFLFLDQQPGFMTNYNWDLSGTYTNINWCINYCIPEVQALRDKILDLEENSEINLIFHPIPNKESSETKGGTKASFDTQAFIYNYSVLRVN